jgi:uncharacterized protein YbjQ (UPF0145 family)
MSFVKVVTTPSIPGYKINEVIGVVTGLSPRTRGWGSQFHAGLQSIMGGEVTAFTSEIEKARAEAIDRAIEQAKSQGANAIVGLDIETSDVGSKDMSVMLISATGTAIVVEPE